MNMTEQEILDLVSKKRKQMAELCVEIENLELQLKRMKAADGLYLVRIYVNARKSFRQKKFKTLEGAKKFINEKCRFSHYDGYFNLGVTLSVTTPENPDDGEFLEIYYPLSLIGTKGDKNYNTTKLIENLLNTSPHELNSSFRTDAVNSYEELDRMTRSLNRFLDSLKSQYLKNAKIQVTNYQKRIYYNDGDPNPILELVSDIENGLVKIPNAEVSYNRNFETALFSIKIT